LTDAGGQLFFTANDGTHGVELWRTDGTGAGTTMVVDLTNGGGSHPAAPTNANGGLYFIRPYNGKNQEMLKSGGTAAGTILVKDTYTSGGEMFPIGADKGTLYLDAKDGPEGYEPWVLSPVRRVNQYVVGASASNLPQVRVYDRTTQAVTFNLLAYAPRFTGGVRVAVGDLAR